MAGRGRDKSQSQKDRQRMKDEWRMEEEQEEKESRVEDAGRHVSLGHLLKQHGQLWAELPHTSGPNADARGSGPLPSIPGCQTPSRERL